MSLLSPKRFRGGGGELIAEVGLGERPEADPGRAQAVEAPAQAHFVPDATDDDGGMLLFGREERPRGFQRGVTGLDHLLRVAQVAADEDVDVRPFSNLREPHEKPPFGKRASDTASGGTRTRTHLILETRALPLSYGRAHGHSTPGRTGRSTRGRGRRPEPSL